MGSRRRAAPPAARRAREEETTKSTSPLRALARTDHAENCISIHPNDGFDLDMMQTSYDVELEGGGRAEVRLRNDCPRECVEANARFWERAGKPAKVVLEYDGTRLFVKKA